VAFARVAFRDAALLRRALVLPAALLPAAFLPVFVLRGEVVFAVGIRGVLLFFLATTRKRVRIGSDLSLVAGSMLTLAANTCL
jgi:hypothetical protein